MNNSDIFLDLYKQLEQTAISVYDLPADGTAVSRLERFGEYKGIREKLKYCREVRALLTHNPKINGQYAAIPSDEMLETLRFVIARIKEPPLCIDRAVRGSNILSATPESEILPVMKLMRMFGYSFIPVMKNGRVAGVFGKHTIFSLMLDGGVGKIVEGSHFSDISTYLSLSRKDKDSFRFIPRTTYIYEAENLVVSAFRKKERINMLFITENGKASEALLGIITPWDVMG